MPLNSPNQPFDVFLSHNTADKPSVKQLARRLEEAQLTTWLDEWDLIPGDDAIEALEKALGQSRACAVFLGPSGVGLWQKEERQAVLRRRVRNRNFRVIPVLLPGATLPTDNDLPDFLLGLIWVDFRMNGLEDAEAFHRLVCGIKGISPRRGPISTPTQIECRNHELEALDKEHVRFLGGSDVQVTISKGRQHLPIFAILVAVIAIFTLATYYFISRTGQLPSQPAASPTVEERAYLRGQVNDERGEGLPDATVTVDEITGHSARHGTTTGNGGFIIDKIPAPIGERVRVFVSKEGYVTMQGAARHDQYIVLPGPLPIIQLKRKK